MYVFLIIALGNSRNSAQQGILFEDLGKLSNVLCRLLVFLEYQSTSLKKNFIIKFYPVSVTMYKKKSLKIPFHYETISSTFKFLMFSRKECIL